MVDRTEYLQQLSDWRDEPVIKVVTGIRRCGKSTLLQQFQQLLRRRGVGEDQIIALNFEMLEYEDLLDHQKLYAYLQGHLAAGKTTYIFLDEIQKVPAFEKVVDSLYIRPGVDLYITGSNAYLLSGDLATLLSGRYVEIRLLPFSLREFLAATGLEPQQGLSAYLQTGGLPYLSTLYQSPEKAEVYLEGMYNTVLVKDMEERQSRQTQDLDRRKVFDVALLKNIARYLASVVGSPVSVRGITDYLVSGGRKISPNTVSDYLQALTDAFLFYPVERFDVVGKQLLKTNRKLYIVDLALRDHMLPRRNYDLGFSLENIVYLELLRRGYRVTVGRCGNAEVDFVAQKQRVLHYFQVTADMTAPQTFEREMAPLRAIQDNYEKTVLTLDRLTPGNYDGIRVLHLLDWLLG